MACLSLGVLFCKILSKVIVAYFHIKIPFSSCKVSSLLKMAYLANIKSRRVQCDLRFRGDPANPSHHHHHHRHHVGLKHVPLPHEGSDSSSVSIACQLIRNATEGNNLRATSWDLYTLLIPKLTQTLAHYYSKS